MRVIFTILFLISVAYGQTNYYVSNSGSDANNGLSTATAWQTIAKINSSTFNSGDSIFLKRGDSWNERLIPPSNGIYIGAYGTGNKPIINGLQTITGFTQSGNIWTKTVTASADLNLVLLNGQIAHKGRYPNATELQYTSKGTNYLQTSLTGTPNYTGAQVVARTAPWQLEKSIVTSQVAGKLNVSPNFILSTPLQADLYFLQNLASLVDTLNEYSYDGTTLTVYSTTTPTVQVSAIDTLCWLRKLSNVTIDNISFVGAGKTAIQFDTCSVVTVNNCSVNYSGTVALAALKSSRLSILNDSITNSLSSAMRFMQIGYYSAMAQQCDSARVIGNYIKNTGVIAGMGEGGTNSNSEAVSGYYAIWIQGLNLGPYVANNIIDSTGYTGMELSGKKYVSRNNVVSNFCFVKEDGAGIRSVIGTYPADYNDSGKIVSNIAYNGTGTKVLFNGVPSQASGIYLDDNSRRITIDSNTSYNNVLAGVYLHSTTQIKVTNNNLYQNGTNFFINYVLDSAALYFTNNSLFANSGNPLMYFNGGLGDTSHFGYLDSNFYYNPLHSPVIVQTGSNSGDWKYYNLSGWQSAWGKDIHSQLAPLFATPANPTVLINNSLAPVTYNLGSTYIANGRSFNSITLQPTSSVMMFKSAYNTFNNYPIRYKKLNQ